MKRKRSCRDIIVMTPAIWSPWRKRSGDPRRFTGARNAKRGVFQNRSICRTCRSRYENLRLAAAIHREGCLGNLGCRTPSGRVDAASPSPPVGRRGQDAVSGRYPKSSSAAHHRTRSQEATEPAERKADPVSLIQASFLGLLRRGGQRRLHCRRAFESRHGHPQCLSAFAYLTIGFCGLNSC